MNGIALNSFKSNLIDQIILDSGATNHIFGNKNFLTNLRIVKNDQHVRVANGMKVQINGIGALNIFSKRKKRCNIFRSFFNQLRFN